MFWKQYIKLIRLIDTCKQCLACPMIEVRGCTPTRPYIPATNHPIVFLGEPPTVEGSFWNVNKEYRSRRILFEAVLPHTTCLNDEDSLAEFVNSGYYYLEALKWPLKRTYKELAPKLRALVDHTAQDHLRSELELLGPRALICLGTAGKDLLHCLFENHFLKEPLRMLRNERFILTLEGKSLPILFSYHPSNFQQAATMIKDVVSYVHDLGPVTAQNEH